MLRTQVTIQVPGSDRAIHFVFETDHDDIEHLYEDLAEEGVAYGDRIDTERVGNSARREVRRAPFILGSRAVCTITPVHFELLPPEGASVEPRGLA